MEVDNCTLEIEKKDVSSPVDPIHTVASASIENHDGENESGGTNHSEDEEPSTSKAMNSTGGQATGLTIMALNDTKAGMEGLDVHKINQIIAKASEGSKFYLHKKRSQEALDEKIGKMQALAKGFTQDQILKSEKEMDLRASEMRIRSSLARTIVHIDMDAFYAAVEMRDNPDLKNVPMAVGSNSMLCTSNYLARKFGVRAGMAGFIGKKLCRDLIIIEPNFDKYIEISRSVCAIIREYDIEAESLSLDEVRFDLTDYLYCKNSFTAESSQVTSVEVVEEIRRKIFEATQLTASAGIAPNGLLAKICSDKLKPNNQYYLESTREAVKKFIDELPVRKVCGIGAVTEQILKGMDIHFCRDIWEKRGIINLLMKPATVSYLLRVSMGIGSYGDEKDDSADSNRKSMSRERTFRGTSNLEELKELCKELSEELQSDLESKGYLGKSIAIKIKTVEYDVKTRIRTLADYTSDSELICSTSIAILSSYISQIPNLKLRLLGIRVSSIIKSKSTNGAKTSNLEDGNMEVDQIDDSQIVNQERKTSHGFASQKRIDVLLSEMNSEAHYKFECPVCNLKFKSERIVTAHVDECLDKVLTAGDASSSLNQSEQQASSSSISPATSENQKSSIDSSLPGSNSRKRKREPLTLDHFFKVKDPSVKKL